MKGVVILGIVIIVILAVSLILKLTLKRKETYISKLNNKYSENDICIYIFLWKKVSQNALKLYDVLSKTFNDIIIIDCDETNTINKPNIIKLDDNAYYGKQFDTSIKHAKNNKIVGIFVGDIDPNKLNGKKIKDNLLYSINNKNVGIYAPNDVRSDNKSPVHVKFKDKNFDLGKIDNTNLFRTSYTDCTCWFFTPELISMMKNIDFTKTNLGWGIDLSLIKLAIKNGYNVVKDYSVNIYNPPGTNYKSDKAHKEMDSFYEYLTSIELFKGIDLPQRNITINPKIHLIFFGDKTKNSLKEATDLNFFDTITPYNEKIYKDKVEISNKTYKYLACLKKIEDVEYNDIIIYCNSNDNIKKILDYSEYALKNDLFEYSKDTFIIKKTPQNIDFLNRNI